VVFKSEFHVNIDAVVAASDRIASTFERLGGMIESQMYGIVKDIIVTEFESAMEIAESQMQMGAFLQDINST
jgi:hypothetical protein